MDSEQLQSVCSAAEDSCTTVEDYLEKPNDRAARLRALRDAKRLVTELQDKDDALFAPIEHGIAAYALRFMMSIGAFQKIPKTGSITAAQLAADVGSEKSLIGMAFSKSAQATVVVVRIHLTIPLVRIMRILIAAGVFEEVQQDEYKHTRHSISLLEPGYGEFFEIMVDDLFYTWSRLPEYFESHRLESPSSPTHNPRSWSYGMEGHDWATVVARTPEKLEKFNIAMSGKWSAAPVIGTYPFETELSSLSAAVVKQDRVFLVDIGGGQGRAMKELREAYPALKGKTVIQDLARVVDNIPSGLLPPGLDIHHQVHDFWAPQPIRNAGVYYMKRILHDWPDDQCKKLLGHVVDAMGPDSRLLIADTVIPDRVQREDLYCYWMDMTMLTFAGKERSEADWRDLFESVGLDLVKVWKESVGTFNTIEGRLKRN
ncbi:hypothetical protein OEA41_006918 [Lepraria neglecta]|uniref:O-methyltransferase C-terminal domain-containing protein n=1 Tax=Lepraria neglecta TaxID=209136 RepID=A0AAD9Z9P5_9LECA|nr:hypothetical protein OEA41_006918 [Lepraria neglecta]